MHRIAPNPEQSMWLRRISNGAVCQEVIPPSVFAFLVTQRLVSDDAKGWVLLGVETPND